MSTTELRGRLRSWLRTLRRIDAEITELQERQRLLHRPWEEEYVHWSHAGDEWRLHGSVLGSDDGRRHSVTRDGWCVGAR